MDKLKSIKLDGAFPEHDTKKLEEALNSGWEIRDKTVLGERYVLYILIKRDDPDLGKCSDTPTNPQI